ncbi:hypothetical protein [Kingella oralis]|uniref:hypothetical protein n=1 Tax=Kingella oralis TaxID=505 RepID=UPI0034E53A3E
MAGVDDALLARIDDLINDLWECHESEELETIGKLVSAVGEAIDMSLAQTEKKQ